MADTPFHEAASIFPLMEGKDLEALADDIRKNGLQLPIEIFEDAVLEGRNRYRACLLAGIDPEDHMIEVDPPDPVAYVVSMNLHRRHLDESQRAMVGGRIKEYEAARAKERQGTRTDIPDNLPESEPGDARDKAGQAVNVSGKSVDCGAKVLAKGSAKLQAAVDAGQVAVSPAAKLADLSKAEQDKALAAGKAAIQEAIKPDWAKGPTPQEQAEHDPERRWSASMHKLYMFMNSTRDVGGIAKLTRKWSATGRQDYVTELNRVIGVLQKWIKLLEKKHE